jgi:hypothetical protein
VPIGPVKKTSEQTNETNHRFSVFVITQVDCCN